MHVCFLLCSILLFKRLSWKKLPKMTYFVSGRMSNLNSVNHGPSICPSTFSMDELWCYFRASVMERGVLFWPARQHVTSMG